MTIPMMLTVLRILLIPVFVMFAIYYGASVEAKAPQEWLRWAAVAAFVIASVTDAFDGMIARRLHQESKLGALLDPIADKGLLLTAIITLSVSPWHYALPLWFPVLVIARDAVIVLGCVAMRMVQDHLEVRPSFAGKAATALQMVAVAWAMFQIPYLEGPVWAAGFFTFVSGIEYVFRGVAQMTHHEAAGKP
ncbi:MAG TPA: CDP-diacylglycerol--glycerol-3-phosphate 3-phosphatidyltransferase [Chthoniobacterales bacterium]|jgi:CDP-diacylglycerol--glycerol-3-phosphate 3-phosphatidyltransferase